MYLDDWLSRAISRERAAAQHLRLSKLITEVGFIINLPKSLVIPSQTFDFVGYNFRLAEALVAPTTARISDLVASCRDMLSKTSTTPRELMQIIGKMASVEKVVLHGRIHLRPLQWEFDTEKTHTNLCI